MTQKVGEKEDFMIAADEKVSCQQVIIILANEKTLHISINQHSIYGLTLVHGRFHKEADNPVW